MFCAISFGFDRRLIFSTASRPFIYLTKPGSESAYRILGIDIKIKIVRFETHLIIRRRKIKKR